MQDNGIVFQLIQSSQHWLMPLMFSVFGFSVIGRFIIYYTVRAENRFCKEFEKRVLKYLADPEAPRINSFYRLTKQLLEKTYYEAFEIKTRYKRRNLDHITTITDRIFLIQDGAQRLVEDTLKRAKYLKKDAPPRLVEISKTVFDLNPVFNRVMGVFPLGLFNEFLSIMPGLFMVCGILGTFMGIMKSLPELGGMDLANIEETKKVMDLFLIKISHSMLVSVAGIVLSVGMSVLNTIFSPEGLYYSLVNSYSGSMEALWNETSNNDFDKEPHTPSGGPGHGSSAPGAHGFPQGMPRHDKGAA